MHNELLIAVLAGIGGMLGWGLADFFAKKTIDAIGDVVSLVWAHVAGTLVLLLLVLGRFITQGTPFIPHISTPDWGLLVLFGIGQAAVYLFVYKGFGKGQLAVLNPVFASFSGLTALLSMIIYHEVVREHRLLVLGILFVGVLLLSLDFKALATSRPRLTHVPGLREVGFATILAAFWTLFWDKFIGADWLSYVFLMYVCMTITMFIVAKLQHVDLRFSKKNMWVLLFLIGFCEIIAYLAVSIGYAKTSMTSVVALLSGAFSLPTIILAYIFLKERVTKLQTVGACVIIIGIVLLALL